MKASELIPGVEFKIFSDPKCTFVYNGNERGLWGRKDEYDNRWMFVGIVEEITKYGFNLFRYSDGIHFRAKLEFKALEIIPEGMDHTLSKKSDGCSL